jgi:hypothetical protein
VKRFPRRLGVAVLAVAAAAAFPARAGVPARGDDGIPLRWVLNVEQPNVVGGRITWFVDPLTSVEEPPGDETERDAITFAAQAWESAPGSRVRLVEDTSRPAFARKATDRVNYIGWKAQTLSPLTLAATYVTASNGLISDADIILNDTTDYVLWSTASPGLPGYADVQSVATHEIGHLLGLDHTPVATASMAAVQYVGTVSSRSLSPDDVGALLETYPETNQSGVGSIVGTLRVGSRRAPAGIPVFALDARTGTCAGSAFTEPSGIYRVRGLPPGPYHVAAAPLATTAPYSAWWADAPGDLGAGFLEEDLPGGGRAPATVIVRAGFPEANRDFSIRRVRRRVAERPDDDEVRDLPRGGGAAGVFEEPFDEDWYRVPADGLNPLDVRVLAWGLGSSADVEVAVFLPGGFLLASNIDVRSPVDDAAFHGPDGIDLDAGLAEFVPPAPSDLLVRVRAQPGSETGRAGAFYLLQVVPSAGVPDAARTTASVSPAATRIPGGPPATLTAIPRDARGDPVGPGATVTAFRSDTDAQFPLADLGDGTYAGPVGPPSAPGTIRFSLLVSAPKGDAGVPEVASLSVAGAADAAASSLVATPRRVAADGTSPSTLVYTPRDAAGRPLGTGLAAALVFEGAPAGSLGPTSDLDDGRYSAVLVAPASPGSARISVTIGGAPTGVSRLVGFGWDLPLVAADLGAEVVEASGKPGVSRRESADFGKADGTLDEVLAALGAGDEPAAAAASARAFRDLVRAGRSPRFPDGAAASAEILEALRRRAHALVDPLVPDEATLAAVVAARALLDRAEDDLESGRAPRAARGFAAAIRRAGPLL